MQTGLGAQIGEMPRPWGFWSTAGRRAQQPERHCFEVLHDGGEMELVACAGKTPEPHALEAVMRLHPARSRVPDCPV
jgi:Na+-translocating ferredoxin:NAD+ oxidoreductase RnfG subunit